MIRQLIGNFPSLTASGSFSLPLRSLMPKHSIHGFRFRVTATLTEGGTADAGALTTGDIDTVLTTIISRFRLYGGSLGEPINMSLANMHSAHMLATGARWTVFDTTDNVSLYANTIQKSTANNIAADIVIPFCDRRATLDPDWCAPSTDQFRHEAFMELQAGTLAATAALTGGGKITATAISVELSVMLDDAHGVFVAPIQAFREQGQVANNQDYEPGLYLDMWDTRNALGSSAYNPTYNVRKDGKDVVQNLNGQALAFAFLQSSMPVAAFDPTTRIGPIMYHAAGYSEDDLKPSLGNHTVNIPSGFTAGTTCYRVLRGVTAEQEAKLAQYEGMNSYKVAVRSVLGKGHGDEDFGKIALFKPRYIAPA